MRKANEKKKALWETFFREKNYDLSTYVGTLINQIKRLLNMYVEGEGCYTGTLRWLKDEIECLEEIDSLFKGEIDFTKVEETIKDNFTY